MKYQNILDRCANRDSIPQFFDGNYDYRCNYYNNRVEVSNQDFLAIVIDYDKDKKIATIEQRNYFKKGDVVEFFGPNKEFEYQIDNIYDEKDDLIEIVRHPRQIVRLKIDIPLEKNDLMRVKI